MVVDSLKVAVYGLSTEGYKIASRISVMGIPVAIVDESTGMAITLKPIIANRYSDATAFLQEETLLDFEPFDDAISNATSIFFAPRIRKSWPDAKGHVGSHFQDLLKHVSKGSTLVCAMPVGFGVNNENISLIEHRTGLKVGKDIYYQYMPASSITANLADVIIGTKAELASNISDLLGQINQNRKIEFMDIESAEYLHCIRIMKYYGSRSPLFEICKFGDFTQSKLMKNECDKIYIDDLVSGLFDLNAILYSLSGVSPLTLLVKGYIATVDNYLKHLTEKIRIIIKKYELKASKTKAIISWTIDPNEMRGDRLETLSKLQFRLRDYVGEIERHDPSFDFYSNEKQIILVACSKNDFDKIKNSNPDSENMILEASPLLHQSSNQTKL